MNCELSGMMNREASRRLKAVFPSLLEGNDSIQMTEEYALFRDVEL